MFTNNGSTLQTDITTFGVNMKLAHLGRQALMGVMAVALVAGMSVKSFADEGLLNKVKERGTLLVGLEGTYPPFSFQGDDGKLTGFEVEFAQQLAKHLGVEASLKPTKWDVRISLSRSRWASRRTSTLLTARNACYQDR